MTSEVTSEVMHRPTIFLGGSARSVYDRSGQVNLCCAAFASGLLSGQLKGLHGGVLRDSTSMEAVEADSLFGRMRPGTN